MAGHQTRVMYIERKSGHHDDGPARIGRVSFSQTGRTIYYKGRSFRSLKGSGIGANYFDVETGEEYWISGPKRNGEDRHWAESVRLKSTPMSRTSIGARSASAIRPKMRP